MESPLFGRTVLALHPIAPRAPGLPVPLGLHVRNELGSHTGAGGGIRPLLGCLKSVRANVYSCKIPG